MNSLLNAKKVRKQYQSGGRTLNVLKNVNLEVNRGEAIAVVGASGTGKSTLLHLLGALDTPTDGTISLDGNEYSKMKESALAKIRNHKIGFIYQFHHLLPEFTALENVMLPGLIDLKSRSNKNLISGLWALIHPTCKASVFSEVREKAEDLLRRIGLEERMNHRPTKLSGGEQQRVALARALINNPDLVLADEPTGNLDLATGDKVLDIVMQQTAEMEKAIILVTHNPDIASRLEKTYRLSEGSLSRES